MKKIILAFFLYCTFTLLVNPTLSAEETYDTFNYFPLDVGNSWQYEIIRKTEAESVVPEKINTRVTSIKGSETLNGKEVFILEEDINEGPWFYLTPSPEGILLYKIRYKDYYDLIEDPALLFYPKDLQLEQRITYAAFMKRYDLNNNLIAEGTIQMAIMLKEAGNKAVPAGAFQNCIKIIQTISVNIGNASSMSITERIWLAPNIGRIYIQRKDFTAENIDYFPAFELKNAIIKGNKIGETDAKSAEETTK